MGGPLRQRIGKGRTSFSHGTVELARRVNEVLAQVEPRDPERTAHAMRTAAEELVMQEDITRILMRLDAEIPEAQKRMDELLSRLRTTRIVSAA